MWKFWCSLAELLSQSLWAVLERRFEHKIEDTFLALPPIIDWTLE